MSTTQRQDYSECPDLGFKEIVFPKIQKAHAEVYNYEMFRGLIFKNVSINRKYKMLTLDEWSKHLNVPYKKLVFGLFLLDFVEYVDKSPEGDLLYMVTDRGYDYTYIPIIPTKINNFVWNIHAMVLVEHQVCDI